MNAAEALPEPEPIPETAPAPEPEPEWTIDELSSRTGIPSRTIRFYQSSGALPRPTRRGRVAVYGPRHEERLQLIGRLQDRGLRIRAIKELVQRIDRGEVALDEWLGLEEKLQSDWSDDKPQLMSRDEFEQKVGERRPGFRKDLDRYGIVELQAEGTVLVRSPGLLDLALRLADADIDLEVSAGANKILEKHLHKAAKELAEHFIEHAHDSVDNGEGLAAFGESLEALRPAAGEAVRLVFAREMEAVLRKLVERGEAATVTGRKRRRRR